MNAKLILVVLLGMLVVAGTNAVSGQDWGGFPCAPPFGGYPYQNIYSTESVPYYSLYPPVYYSYRVARTYGYSPFAYPPGVLTPGSEPPRGAAVQNVYTTTEGAETSELQHGRPPLRIDNPFVQQPGVAKARMPAGRQPQVVYPMAMTSRAK